MKLFKIVAAAAIALSTTAFSAQALTVVNGSLDGIAARANTDTIALGSALNFAPVALTLGALGEYSGYTLDSIGSLTLATGAGNNGAIFSASNGADSITFTVSDTIVASINSIGPGVAPGWSLAGVMSVSGTSALLSTTASFSLSGTSVNTAGYDFFIQTPPAGSITPVPLPASALLLGGALLILRGKRRKTAKPA